MMPSPTPGGKGREGVFYGLTVKLEKPPVGVAVGVPGSDADRRSARSALWAHSVGLGDHCDGPPTKHHH